MHASFRNSKNISMFHIFSACNYSDCLSGSQCCQNMDELHFVLCLNASCVDSRHRICCCRSASVLFLLCRLCRRGVTSCLCWHKQLFAQCHFWFLLQSAKFDIFTSYTKELVVVVTFLHVLVTHRGWEFDSHWHLPYCNRCSDKRGHLADFRQIMSSIFKPCKLFLSFSLCFNSTNTHFLSFTHTHTYTLILTVCLFSTQATFSSLQICLPDNSDNAGLQNLEQHK